MEFIVPATNCQRATHFVKDRPMGRKPNSMEAASSLLSDIEAKFGVNRIALSRSQSLLQQIAQQLGISPDEFFKAPCPPVPVLIEHPTKEAFDPLLARESLDLLEAFTRIDDPEERLRCLQVVRDAAEGEEAPVCVAVYKNPDPE